MLLDLSNLVAKGETIAVALSGGCDSIALLHYMLSISQKYQIKIIALNVEHGIRGESSISDTEFCISYCKSINVPLLTYSVDAVKNSKEQKVSLEQSARELRYQCFFDAINNKKCDKVATAHHLDDNFESVLFNLFRGTGAKGASGIITNYQNQIIRPFLTVQKSEITAYANQHSIPFVTDQTNFCADYTRNALRLNVIPQIKELFPQAEKSLLRFTQILKTEDDFMQQASQKAFEFSDGIISIKLPVHPAIFSRACVIALKKLGVEKDYEKIHIDSAYSLIEKQNGNQIDLPQGIKAVREYDKIVFYKQLDTENQSIPFFIGKKAFNGAPLEITELLNAPNDLKNGFYADLDKIPDGAIIRQKMTGDVFTKFGGGSKSLGDYLTDKKIPKRLREDIPLLAKNNTILAIFGVAVSDKIKIDENTKRIVQLKY